MMNPSSRSSGDLLADRRYAYADAAYADGDVAAAIDLARQALELAPDFAPAHALLGRACLASGARETAIAALSRALELEPEDPLGVRIDLAHLGALPPEEAIGDGYVRALFDEYAGRFDRHLVDGLKYRGPELIGDAVRRARAGRGETVHFRRVLDLGCGTGLVAGALGGTFDAIEGVDLSPRMLAKAKRTRLYDRLHEGDLGRFLADQPERSADLVVAADVFVYVARLEAVFAGVRRVLEPGGLFAFTVQASQGEDVALGADARYGHSERYLRGLAEMTGFAVRVFKPVSTRQDRGLDVPGYLAALAA